MNGTTAIAFTRSELYALKEVIELDPGLDGRAEVRTAIQHAVRARTRPGPLCIGDDLAVELARRIVPYDVPSAALRAKINRAVQRTAGHS